MHFLIYVLKGSSARVIFADLIWLNIWQIAPDGRKILPIIKKMVVWAMHLKLTDNVTVSYCSICHGRRIFWGSWCPGLVTGKIPWSYLYTIQPRYSDHFFSTSWSSFRSIWNGFNTATKQVDEIIIHKLLTK